MGQRLKLLIFPDRILGICRHGRGQIGPPVDFQELVADLGIANVNDAQCGQLLHLGAVAQRGARHRGDRFWDDINMALEVCPHKLLHFPPPISTLNLQ